MEEFTNERLLAKASTSCESNAVLTEIENDDFVSEFQFSTCYYVTTKDHVSAGQNALKVLEERIRAGTANAKEVCDKLQKVYAYQTPKIDCKHWAWNYYREI